MENALKLLEKLKNDKCEIQFTELSPFDIDGNNQHKNACIVSSYLKKLGKNTFENGIPIGNETLQKVFYPMTSLTDSLSSSEGIIAVSGLMGSKQFINIKYPHKGKVDKTEGADTDTDGTEGEEGTERGDTKKENSDISILYEIAIGTALNKLRRKIPNFRYTYSGLYCGVPVDPSKTKYIAKENFENILQNILDKYIKVDSSFLMMEFSEFIRKGELNRNKVVNFLVQNIIEYIKDKERTYTYTKLRQFIFNIRDENMQKSIYNEIFTAYQLYIKRDISDFDNSLFCSDKNVRVLMLSEFIPNAKTLLEIYDELSRDEMFNIFCQLFFTLNMAWQEYKFFHNDMHLKNILIRQLDNPITINYSVLVTEGKIVDVPLITDKIAIIIDYSYCKITYQGENYSQNNESSDNNLDVDNLIIGTKNIDDKLSALMNLANSLNLRDKNFSPKLYEEIIKIFK
jgi:hypothetical protein